MQPYLLTCDQPEKPFRFMDLPRELREIVYELVLPVDQSIDLWPRLGAQSCQANVHAFRSNLKHYKRTITPTLKLLRVNKTINEEASSIFYGKNEFRFTNVRGFLVLQCFLDTIGLANASRLRHVAVHAPFYGHYLARTYFNDADNLPDSISNMDSLQTFLRSVHLRIPKIRQTFNMRCAVNKVCSILARSGAAIQVSLILPLDFHTTGLDNPSGEGSINSRAVKKNALGFRPTFEEVATAFGDVKMSLVLLGWTPGAQGASTEEDLTRYLDAHQDVMQHAESAEWTICEAFGNYDGLYRIRPFNLDSFKDPSF